MKRAALGLALACTAACSLGETEPVLVDGQYLHRSLSADSNWSQRWRLPVTEDCIWVAVEFRSSPRPLSLYGYAPDSQERLLLVPGGERSSRWILDRCSTPTIRAGDWILELCDEGPRPVQSGSRMLRELSYQVAMHAATSPTPTPLLPGKPVHVEVPFFDCGTHSFVFEVPPGTRHARVDVFDTSSDWSLYARHGRAVGTLDADLATRATPCAAETLRLGDDEDLHAGLWYLDVIDSFGAGSSDAFSIVLSLDEAAPALLMEPPPALPEFADAFERALACVVEVAGANSVGSGTLIHPEGWILTNAHVVEDIEKFVIAWTEDPALAPRERFLALRQWSDPTLDLALLKVVSGLYGQTLPPAFRFPFVECADPEELREGSAVWLVGYPRTGGSTSRVPRHATHGVVSGFESSEGGVRIKSDAAIYFGNSGGAALNEAGQLVAVPSFMIEYSSGQTAFLHPWTWVPSGWRSRAGLPEKP